MSVCIIPARYGHGAPRAQDYYLGRVLVRAAAAEKVRLGRRLCGFNDPFHSVYPDVPTDPWEPGNLGRVVLTVSNENAIQDDGWDFKIDGVTVCNYDGGGQTTIQFSKDIPPGYTLALSAECVDELSDNLFRVTVTVDGASVIDTEISGDGTVGQLVPLGNFNT